MKINIVSLILMVFFLTPFAFNASDVFASSCSQIGNTTYCDDGISYSRIGNTAYGSDGSSYSQIGNTTYGNGNATIFSSCPTNSSYDYLSDKCKCNSGYVVSGSSCVYKIRDYPSTPIYSLVL